MLNPYSEKMLPTKEMLIMLIHIWDSWGNPERDLCHMNFVWGGGMQLGLANVEKQW